MTIAKWICTVLFILISILCLEIASDTGEGVMDWVEFPILISAIVLAILNVYFWYNSFRNRRNAMNVFFVLFPFLMIGLYLMLYKTTQSKINKEFFLSARNDDSEHRYVYYFRADGTLKTYGDFFLGNNNVFQSYTMKGDTIFLDTILSATGIQSKMYLKKVEYRPDGTKMKLLVPLDRNLIQIDTLTKFIVEVDKSAGK